MTDQANEGGQPQWPSRPEKQAFVAHQGPIGYAGALAASAADDADVDARTDGGQQVQTRTLSHQILGLTAAVKDLAEAMDNADPGAVVGAGLPPGAATSGGEQARGHSTGPNADPPGRAGHAHPLQHH